ncbi:MAG: hypothetical protein M1824_006548 [Vezdaea acicularis]|nr:MAG: hypothetical protein M1824_006548 [Vezdaea acicularis]
MPRPRIRPQSCLLCHPCPLPPHRPSSTLASQLSTELLQRPLPILRDTLSPTPSYLLSKTLCSFLPTSAPRRLPLFPTEQPPLPPGHHLVYFPPPLSLDSLLPDSTDPATSPGPSWTRRLWAGGSIRFHPPSRGVRADGRRVVMVERIVDVRVKGGAEQGGRDGEEKVFVTIDRQMLPWSWKTGTKDSTIRSIVQAGLRSNILEERRELVFMRAKAAHSQGEVEGRGGVRRPVKAPHAPSLSHTLLPTPSLLFRYSALTYNAHAIHLSPAYCLSEGHRNLLVHGPLLLTLMLTLIQERVIRLKGKNEWMITRVEYRNLAPLYVGEELRVCARRVKEDEKGGMEGWEVWCEGPGGGLAVRGVVEIGRVQDGREDVVDEEYVQRLRGVEVRPYATKVLSFGNKAGGVDEGSRRERR